MKGGGKEEVETKRQYLVTKGRNGGGKKVDEEVRRRRVEKLSEYWSKGDMEERKKGRNCEKRKAEEVEGQKRRYR